MKLLNWIFEIKEYPNHIKTVVKDRDDLAILLKVLIEECGEEPGTRAFVKLYEWFNKSDIKLIEKPLEDLQRIFVYQNRSLPAKQIGRKLDIDPQTVFRWWREYGLDRNSGNNDNQQLEVFKKERNE